MTREEKEKVLVFIYNMVDRNSNYVDPFNDEEHLLRDMQHIRDKIEELNESLEIKREHLKERSEERRVGKECRSRWSPYQ